MYQSLELSTRLILTDNFQLALRSGQPSYSIVPATADKCGLQSPSYTVTGVTAGLCQINATFFGVVAGSPLDIDVLDTNTSITQLINLQLRALAGVVVTSPSLTMQGIATVGRAVLQVGGVFDDGTRYTSLISTSGAPVLPGVLEYGNSDEAVLQLSQPDASLRLISNGQTTASVTSASHVGPLSKAVASIEIAGNLEPTVGDIDLGPRTGYPGLNLALSGAASVILRVNTGAQQIGSYGLQLTVNSSLLEVVDVTTLYASGPVDFNVIGDTVLISGVVLSPLRGSAANLLQIELQAKGVSGQTVISGRVESLKDDTVQASDLGGFVGSSFVAGVLEITVGDPDRRRRAPPAPAAGRCSLHKRA